MASGQERWYTVVLLQETQAIPKLALPVMSQEALVLAFCKLFPASWFSNFKFAMVEDLTSLMAPRSAHTQHGWPDPTHGIRCSEAASTDWGRVPRAALVALVRLPPLNWCAFWKSAATSPATPTSRRLASDRFRPEYVAGGYATYMGPPAVWRQRAIGALWPSTWGLFKKQQCSRWQNSGTSTSLQLIFSYSPHGPTLVSHGIFPHSSQHVESGCQKCWRDGRSITSASWTSWSLASRRSKWFLHSPSAASRVFGLHLDKNTASFHGTPRSGKQRVIDNGDTGGQSERSSDANKLTLCSPIRPAQHISLVMHRWSEDEMRSTHFVFRTPGRQARKTYHQTTATVPCPCRKAWVA